MSARDTSKCPTCGHRVYRSRWYNSRRTDRYINTMTRKQAMRLVRQGKAELRGTNKVGSGTQRWALGEDTRLNYTRLSPSNSYVVCLDDWHSAPEPPCVDDCDLFEQIQHWHEDGPGRFLCAGTCCDEYGPANDDEPDHYHLRADLKRRHDPQKAIARMERHRLHNGKGSR